MWTIRYLLNYIDFSLPWMITLVQYTIQYTLTCLKDIKNWMSHNFLMLNSGKTEVIVLGPKHIRDSLSSNIVNLDGITLASSTTVRNLGVIFDQDLSFNSHVKQISFIQFVKSQ